jgi:hypothetical protein
MAWMAAPRSPNLSFFPYRTRAGRKLQGPDAADDKPCLQVKRRGWASNRREQPFVFPKGMMERVQENGLAHGAITMDRVSIYVQRTVARRTVQDLRREW